ncbi:hypothetical protein XENOCAPTIV_023800, partial [Xenoophorus captivus]
MCDSCGRKGKLKQSLPLLGEVKHFCGISCLLKFCCDKVATQGEVLKATGEATPVIASVMSLADQPAGKSKSADKPAQQGTEPKRTRSCICVTPFSFYIKVSCFYLSPTASKSKSKNCGNLPVPMFLPVTMDSAERIVETIQEIKQKIPSDPYEAELILMAEMVAEEDEEKNNKLETQKEKASGKEMESKETPAPD